MTYYGAKAFKTVRKNTIQVAEDIPEDKYSYKAAPDVRSVGELLSHIALAPTFQLEFHGNSSSSFSSFNFMPLFERLAAETAKPRTKAQVIELLRSESDKFSSF